MSVSNKHFYSNWGPFVMRTFMHDYEINEIVENNNLKSIEPFINQYVQYWWDGWNIFNETETYKTDFRYIVNKNVFEQKKDDYYNFQNEDYNLTLIAFQKTPIEIKQEADKDCAENKKNITGFLELNYGEKIPLSINQHKWIPREREVWCFPSYMKCYLHSFKSEVIRKFVKIDINFGIHPDKVKENELHKYKQIIDRAIGLLNLNKKESEK
jgi:hypothetical protein